MKIRAVNFGENLNLFTTMKVLYEDGNPVRE